MNGCLLVPVEILSSTGSNDSDWDCVDWWLAAFLLLDGCHERLWEQQHGPIHSYSFHLSNWDQRAWQYAWVNRIGLFLRQWAIQRNGQVVHHLGPLPTAEIRVTHDVDALRKTLPIRLKQAAFNLFNAARAFQQGDYAVSFKRLVQAHKFFFSRENWWVFDHLIALENQTVTAISFYSDTRSKTLSAGSDPSYSIGELTQSGLLQRLKQSGHHIGLHRVIRGKTLIIYMRHATNSNERQVAQSIRSPTLASI